MSTEDNPTPNDESAPSILPSDETNAPWEGVGTWRRIAISFVFVWGFAMFGMQVFLWLSSLLIVVPLYISDGEALARDLAFKLHLITKIIAWAVFVAAYFEARREGFSKVILKRQIALMLIAVPLLGLSNSVVFVWMGAGWGQEFIRIPTAIGILAVGFWSYAGRFVPRGILLVLTIGVVGTMYFVHLIWHQRMPDDSFWPLAAFGLIHHSQWLVGLLLLSVCNLQPPVRTHASSA